MSNPKFAIGSQVRLAADPHGQPGEVVGVSRGRVYVRWEDIAITGKHQPDALVSADTGHSEGRQA